MKSKFTGGFRIGKGGFSCINGTYPFAKLTVEDKIYLKAGLWFFSKTYVFELNEVLMKVGVLALGESMQIVHNKPEYSSYIYFHSYQLEEITQLLKSKEVLVEVCEKTKGQKALKLAFKIYVTLFLIIWISGVLLGLILTVCTL